MVARNNSISHATWPIRHLVQHVAFWMAIALVLGIGTSLRAQSYLTSTGTPSFAAPYPVEMGLVDAASGNLHLEIPLASYPQRGGTTANIKLSYDSHIWGIYNDGTTAVWTTLQGSWNLVFPRWSLGNAYPASTYCTFDIPVLEPNGTQHWFHVDLGGTGTIAAGCSLSSATAYAIDSSGIQMQWTYLDPGWSFNVYAPDGTSVLGDATGAAFPEDSNGNYWSPLGSDTLGRPVGVSDCNFDPADGDPNPCTYLALNSQGGTSTYTVSYAAIPVATDFQLSGVSDCNDNCTVDVITSIGLPDGSSYSFTYDCYQSGNAACNSPEGQSGYYGTLTSMTLPTGAQITYGYSTFGGVSWENNNNQYPSRWLTSKASSAGTWTFDPVVTAGAGPNEVVCLPNSGLYVGCMNVQVSRPDGSFEITSFIVDPVGGSWPQVIQSKDSSGTLLSTVNNTWDFSNSCTLSLCYGEFSGNPPFHYYGYQDVRKLSTSTTIPVPGGNITKQTTYTYDTPQTGNITSIKEWKYQSGTFPSVPDRATYITYTTIGTNNNINHPLVVAVCNNTGTDGDCPSGGSKVAKTVIVYDGYGSNGTLALTSTQANITGVVNHDDTNRGSSYANRGNPTLISRWVSGTSSGTTCGSTCLTTSVSYDITGQVIQVLDPKSNPTTYSYADVFYSDNGSDPPSTFTPTKLTNAYVTKVTDAIGTTSAGYYYGSGQLALATDYDAQKTYSHYVDPFDRPTETVYPIGWSLNTYTSPTQADSYSAVGDTAPSISCASCTHTQALSDSLGRVSTQYLVNNPAGKVQVTSTYDGLNRVSTASHPNFGSTDPNDVVETSYYDGLSRPLKVAHPDGEYAQTFYGALVNAPGGPSGLGSQQGSTATYGYGYPVLNVDEAGKQRQEWIDGFGKVIEVDEPVTVATPGTGSFTISGVEQSTQIYTCQVVGQATPETCYRTIWDSGTVSITVNGGVSSVSYGEGSTDASLASSLASVLNGGSSPVTATASNSTVYLTSKATGAISNYSLSATSKTNDPTYFGSSFSAYTSGPNLTGGSNSGSSLATPVVTNYAYDALGNLTEVVQGSQTRAWTYDGLSRLTQEVTPEAGTVTLSYGTPGALCSGNPSNPCTRTAPAPNQTGTTTVTTTYTYNAANQLTQKTHSDTTGTEVYTYGTTAGSFNVGRLITMTDPSGSEAYTYDAIGRVTQLTKIVGTTSYVTKYAYNTGSELTSVTYPSGRVIQYSYDDVGHLCEVAVTAAANCGTATGLYLTLPSANYDAASRPLGATYGNGVVATAAYSPQTAELTSLSYANGSTTLFGLNYYYQQNSTNCSTGNAIGNNGQIQCVADVSSGTGDAGRSVAYTYDALGRLLTANTTGSTQYPAWGLSWIYDRYGNRTAQTVTAGSGYTSSLVINAVNNQITTPAFTYDARGNVMAEPAPGAVSYTYDGEECNTGYTGNGNTATYTCDGNELRVKKAVTGTNAVTTVSIRSGGQVIAEYDNGAAVTAPTREYLYGNNLLAIVTGSTSGSGGTIVYQHRDTLSPRLYTNSTGADVGEQGTYPFGESWYNNNTTSSWVFTTYERDAESGDDYALARSYASTNGRFLSPDPLEGIVGDPQSWNRYAYVENDPINLSDPSGQGFWEDLGLAIASAFVDILCQACIPAMTAVDEGAAGSAAICGGPVCIEQVITRLLIWSGPDLTCASGVCYGGPPGEKPSPGSPGAPTDGDPASATGSNPEGTPANGAGQGPTGGGATTTASGTTPAPGGGTGAGGSGGGSSGPVLYPANSGKPYLATFGGFWGKDWRLGHMGPGGTCCSQTTAESKSMVTLKEQLNGTGPWQSGGQPEAGGFHDLISPEARTITQRFYANGQQIRVVLGLDRGRPIVTMDVKVVVHGAGSPVPPTYSPF
jgi:RHS repeat-associated protein